MKRIAADDAPKRPVGLGAGIITVSSQLLAGKFRDSNAPFLGRQLSAEVGADVLRCLCVPNRKCEIHDAMRYLRDTVGCKIAVVTGGLGVTSEDVTKYAVASFFRNSEFRLDEKSEEELCKKRNANSTETTERHRKLACVPTKSEILENPVGLAPGFVLHEPDDSITEDCKTPAEILNRKGFTVLTMPGVPRELEAMAKLHGIPYLKKRFKGATHSVHSFEIHINLSESSTVDILQDFVAELPVHVSLSVLPSKISVTVKHFDYEEGEKIKNKFEKLAQNLLRPWTVIRFTRHHVTNEEDESPAESETD